MTNRLHLDFSLNTNQERKEFLDAYLRTEQFTKRPPTAEELETMANYLLWGKDPETGLNAKQAGIVDIETKHGTWDRNNAFDSLEGLMESETFNEMALLCVDPTPTKIPRQVFSRTDALAKAPEHLRPTLVNLFRQIDELDLAITCYELAHGKRTKPPRPQLLARFTEEEQEAIATKSSTWNQRKYLKMRHQLVDLRSEQYTIRDSFAPILPNEVTLQPIAPSSPEVDLDIPVFPLGVIASDAPRGLVFREWPKLVPSSFSEEELAEISTYYWKKKNTVPTGTQKYFDFRELEHVYQLLLLHEDM